MARSTNANIPTLDTPSNIYMHIYEVELDIKIPIFFIRFSTQTSPLLTRLARTMVIILAYIVLNVFRPSESMVLQILNIFQLVLSGI